MCVFCSPHTRTPIPSPVVFSRSCSRILNFREHKLPSNHFFCPCLRFSHSCVVCFCCLFQWLPRFPHILVHFTSYTTLQRVLFAVFRGVCCNYCSFIAVQSLLLFCSSPNHHTSANYKYLKRSRMCLIFLLPSFCRVFFRFTVPHFSSRCRRNFTHLSCLCPAHILPSRIDQENHPVKKKSSIICTNTHTQYLHGNLRKKNTQWGMFLRKRYFNSTRSIQSKK